MATLKCQGFFEENNPSQFGFYGPKGRASVRIKHGQPFDYEYDEKSPPDIVERDGRHMIGSWIEVLEKPKKKPGPKPKVDNGDDQ